MNLITYKLRVLKLNSPKKGEKIRIYFALGLLLGDNLGLNGILGFVESFNAYYSCRLCKAFKNEWQTEFLEKK